MIRSWSRTHVCQAPYKTPYALLYFLLRGPSTLEDVIYEHLGGTLHRKQVWQMYIVFLAQSLTEPKLW